MTPKEQLQYETERHQAEVAEINRQIGELVALRERKEAAMHRVVEVLVARIPRQEVPRE